MKYSRNKRIAYRIFVLSSILYSSEYVNSTLGIFLCVHVCVCYGWGAVTPTLNSLPDKALQKAPEAFVADTQFVQQLLIREQNRMHAFAAKRVCGRATIDRRVSMHPLVSVASSVLHGIY